MSADEYPPAGNWKEWEAFAFHSEGPDDWEEFAVIVLEGICSSQTRVVYGHWNPQKIPVSIYLERY